MKISGQTGVSINIWLHLKQQIYLGDDQFVSDQQQYIEKPVIGKALSEVPHKQRRKPAQPLAVFQSSYDLIEAAVCAAFASSGYTQKAIADYFGLHYSMVSNTNSVFKLWAAQLF